MPIDMAPHQQIKQTIIFQSMASLFDETKAHSTIFVHDINMIMQK